MTINPDQIQRIRAYGNTDFYEIKADYFSNPTMEPLAQISEVEFNEIKGYLIEFKYTEPCMLDFDSSVFIPFTAIAEIVFKN